MRTSKVIQHFAKPAILAGLAVFCAAWGQGAAAQDAPKRVVSMNLCTDQLAMLVADEGQLVSVSHLAIDPHMSAMVAQAAEYEINRGLAEQIYLLEPDLVLADAFSSATSVSMLRRLGVPVVTFEAGNSLEDVRTGLREMGVALGREARAAELISAFEVNLASYRNEAAEPLRAALYYANGYTSGETSLAGEILAAAGLANIAEEVGLAAGGIIPLEVLAMAQPDTVITGAAYEAASRAEEVLGHPVIEELRAGRTSLAHTSSDWVCGTPFVLRAIADMATLRDALRKVGP